jgi:hypothetical protein
MLFVARMQVLSAMMEKEVEQGLVSNLAGSWPYNGSRFMSTM